MKKIFALCLVLGFGFCAFAEDNVLSNSEPSSNSTEVQTAAPVKQKATTYMLFNFAAPQVFQDFKEYNTTGRTSQFMFWYDGVIICQNRFTFTISVGLGGTNYVNNPVAGLDMKGFVSTYGIGLGGALVKGNKGSLVLTGNFDLNYMQLTCTGKYDGYSYTGTEDIYSVGLGGDLIGILQVSDRLAFQAGIKVSGTVYGNNKTTVSVASSSASLPDIKNNGVIINPRVGFGIKLP